MNPQLQDWALALANFAFDGALAVLIGSLLLTPGHARTRRSGVIALLWVSLLAALLGGTLAVADERLSMAQNLWLLLSATHSGHMLLLAGFALLLILPAAPAAWHRVGAALLLYARAYTGHAADFPPFAPQVIAHAVHLAAAGAWAGSVLYAAVSRSPPVPAMAQRLSGIATLALAVLAASGALNLERMQQGYAILAAWSAYGLWLALKLALAGAAAVLGLYNRQIYLPGVRAGHPAAAKAFHRVLRIEAVLLLLTLAVAARLACTFPGVAP